MTLGVLQRTERLARRDVRVRKGADGMVYDDSGRPPFRSLVGLQQIVAESMGRGVNTKGVQTRYFQLVDELGSELHILTDASISDISRVGGEHIAEGVERVRTGNIVIEPGYDGVFGKVSVWQDEAEIDIQDKRDRQGILFSA